MQVVGENETFVTQFVLTGCTGPPKSKMEIGTFLLMIYSMTAIGNGLIVLIIIWDPRLHSPMYFFLCNLSIADLCITTTGVPQSIVNCLADRPVMSYPLCLAQAIVLVFFGATECFLLVVMAYDRYVAITHPLHYMLIMNRTVCILLTSSTWIASFLGVVVPGANAQFRFCENNNVDHLVCEGKALFKLLCADASLYQAAVYVNAILFLLLPLGFIIFSYVRIVMAIMKMHSEGSRMKAFSTCGSHLAVVIMYFGTAIFAYLLPQSKETYLHDKIVSVFYILLTPMFNPLIYTLRNKEILAALKRLTGKNK